MKLNKIISALMNTFNSGGHGTWFPNSRVVSFYKCHHYDKLKKHVKYAWKNDKKYSINT